MIGLRVQPVGTKRVRISGLHPLTAACLQELPEVLEFRDRPPARERLFPPLTADDVAANREWEESIGPELRHLFVSAGETVTRDLTGLTPQPRAPTRLCVTIPAAHVSAWMSALNQARLILGELFGITDERDMLIAAFDPHNPKHVAVIKIELLGELLDKFVQLETGETAARRKKSGPKKKRKQ